MAHQSLELEDVEAAVARAIDQRSPQELADLLLRLPPRDTAEVLSEMPDRAGAGHLAAR